MQPVDPSDPRRPYVQIAASIRAAILNGELQPGSRLPSGEELAESYGVTRNTVGSAIRLLRDEGFVTSRQGAGAWVRDEAAMPLGPGEDHQLAGAANFLFEMGRLKHIDRAGWTLLGIPQPETVAEHSFRVGIAAMVLAELEGADVGHTTMLGLMHDAHESRIGDVPSVGRAYTTTAAPEAITAHQTSGMPHDMGKMFQSLTEEYEAGETIEARVARDADKIETLLQAAEYRDSGHHTEAWEQTSVEALRTDAAKQLAQAVLNGDPHWWAAFAASYHELRAASLKRAES